MSVTAWAWAGFALALAISWGWLLLRERRAERQTHEIDTWNGQLHAMLSAAEVEPDRDRAVV